MSKGTILETPNPNLQSPPPQTLRLDGPLDQYAAEIFKAQALNFLGGKGDAILDMGDVDRMHTSSLQVLIALQKDLTLEGRRVVLTKVDPGLRKLFRISGTEELFTFLDGSHD